MEKPKNRYRVTLKYSRNGTSWSTTVTYVNASSEAEAKRLAKAKYPNAKAPKVIGKWEGTATKTKTP